MNNEKERMEIIEKYLNKTLTGKELHDFEKKLKDDKKLREEVNLYRNINNSIIQSDTETFKLLVREVRKTMLEKPNEIRTKRKIVAFFVKYRYYAASLLLAIGFASVFYFSSTRHYSKKQLYSMYFQPYKADIAERSSDSADTIFFFAMEAYNHNDFDKASELLQSFIEKNPDNQAARLYLGISFLQTGHTEKAREQFQFIINSGSILFKEHAQWYFCLTCLKQNSNNNEIKNMLQLIVDENGDYSQQAKALLDKLK